MENWKRSWNKSWKVVKFEELKKVRTLVNIFSTFVWTPLPLRRVLCFVFRMAPRELKFFSPYLINSSFSRSSSTCSLSVLFHWRTHMEQTGPARALLQRPSHQAPIQTFLTSPLVQRPDPNHSLAVWAHRPKQLLLNQLMAKLAQEWSLLLRTPLVLCCQGCRHPHRKHSSQGPPLHWYH